MLDIRDLEIAFDSYAGRVHALRGVQLSVRSGECLALVGESGCGKSATAHAVLGLLPTSSARVLGGQILFDGRDLLSLSRQELRSYRGSRIGMIFQDPLTGLNPTMRVGSQITETLGMDRRTARSYAVELLESVGIRNPESCYRSYPHQLSGGMRQRVMIAIALANQPQMLIADEPTTALDLRTQTQILDLLKEIQQERQMSLLIISHDLGMVAGVADRVAVMYAGQVVELAETRQLFESPQHPYTQALLAALPEVAIAKKRPLQPIPGAAPDLYEAPVGCAFAPRCPHAMGICVQRPVPQGNMRCWLKERL